MDGTPIAALSDELVALVAHTEPAVVGIQGGKRRGASGIAWEPGVVVAADEAVRADEDLRVAFPDGRTAAATVAGRDPSTDIVVLRTDAGSDGPAVPLPPSEGTRPGALVLAVGRRNGSTLARLGIVAQAGGAWQSRRGGRIDRLVRLDITLDGPAEGGAVFDMTGGLVGMAVFGPRGRVIAIPVETVRRIVPLILAHGSIGRGYLGLGLHPVPAGQEGQPGVIVVSIDPNGPGAAAGALVGDVITTWNGIPVLGLRDMLSRLGPDSVDATVDVGIIRAATPAKLAIHVGRRP